jgi:DNA-binding FadR family transcriptional regulator
MAPQGPGIRNVIEHIRQGISSGVYPPGSLLPGRSALAHSLYVSTGTVAPAIAFLKQDGLLAGVRGQRPRVVEPSGTDGNDAHFADRQLSRPPAPASRSWEHVAELMKDDIITGFFRTGAALPFRKELQARYHTSYDTLSRALPLLVRQGMLARKGSRFEVPAVSVPADGGRIAFLWLNDKPFLPAHDTDTTFIRTLEQECRRNVVTLEKFIVIIRNGRVELWRHQGRAPVDSRALDRCMGVVYLINWFAAVDSVAFDWLAHLGKPLTILDWHGLQELPPSLATRKQVQWMQSQVTEKPGFDAARFLIGFGHRRIAYFSPFSLRWPEVRLRGMIQACAAAGPSCTVTPFLQKGVSSEPEVQDLTRTRYAGIRTTIDRPPDFPYGYVAGRTHLAGTAWMEYENATYYSMLLPLFEQALAGKETTAWVGCNDVVAMMAWSFLMSKNVTVPGRISLMGFGNTLETVKADVTSYDFDFSATASAILNFLLRPNLARGVHRLARPRIGGFVIERGSTAPIHPLRTSRAERIRLEQEHP